MCVNFGYRTLCDHCYEHMNWRFLRRVECQKFKATGSCRQVHWIKDKSWVKRKKQSWVCQDACQGSKTREPAEDQLLFHTGETLAQSRRSAYDAGRAAWRDARSA
ncbi:hypothetical protein B0A52_04555 [Exophiala mesophila]|uniref:Uncharacterized protein n=1 Tax=Exophiala mesophila TaxID=212818 RepID=A0A438N9A3_EXOME|nr:hypothetical protein B0A52_04555 [Exophiala mesophila]